LSSFTSGIADADLAEVGVQSKLLRKSILVAFGDLAMTKCFP
jgi:hypothetical protein